MNDRELLELAAKAAGWTVDEIVEYTGALIVHLNEPDATAAWQPLADDGDALRLAVKLDIEVYQGDDEGQATYAGYWHKNNRQEVFRRYAIEYHYDLSSMADPYAATRRAIVRAAAEIGKGMDNR